MCFLTAVAKTTTFMLLKSGKTQHAYMFHDLKSFQSFTTDCEVDCAYYIHGINYVVVITFKPNVLSVLFLIMKVFLNFFNCFLSINCGDPDFFFLHSINMMYYINAFS